jgi:hypothetical protein
MINLILLCFQFEDIAMLTLCSDIVCHVIGHYAIEMFVHLSNVKLLVE